jgi:hypothetical protein
MSSFVRVCIVIDDIKKRRFFCKVLVLGNGGCWVEAGIVPIQLKDRDAGSKAWNGTRGTGASLRTT